MTKLTQKKTKKDLTKSSGKTSPAKVESHKPKKRVFRISTLHH